MSETSTETEKEPTAFRCPKCGRYFDSNQRMQTHRAAAHGYRNRARQKKMSENGEVVKPRSRRALRAAHVDQDLAEIVSRLFPKGVPTKDVVQLADILREIQALRERLLDG
jgi:uncharacterized C2H2 Zn-finger protein